MQKYCKFPLRFDSVWERFRKGLHVSGIRIPETCQPFLNLSHTESKRSGNLPYFCINERPFSSKYRKFPLRFDRRRDRVEKGLHVSGMSDTQICSNSSTCSAQTKTIRDPGSWELGSEIGRKRLARLWDPDPRDVPTFSEPFPHRIKTEWEFALLLN